MKSLKSLMLTLMLLIGSSALAQAAHQTVITVTPPAAQTGVVISGFKVYKGTTSGGETLYATLAASTTQFTYTDTVATPGQTTFYRLTTLCSTCTTTESAFSNEISGTTPNAPNPPSITGTWQ
jgi:hypothetical protein